MKVFRCRICGDPYLGAEKPSHCPFCGATSEYMVPASEWSQPDLGEVTEVSRRNLQRTLEIEIDNAQFYRCAARAGAAELDACALFTGLARIEAEHASTTAKIMGGPKPVIGDAPTCYATTAENLADALERERRAVSFYTSAEMDATELRLKELFAALVEIEGTHVELIQPRMS